MRCAPEDGLTLAFVLLAVVVDTVAPQRPDAAAHGLLLAWQGSRLPRWTPGDGGALGVLCSDPAVGRATCAVVARRTCWPALSKIGRE